MKKAPDVPGLLFFGGDKATLNTAIRDVSAS